ncbi:unnamed protein product [Rangifer tarandus platyrhynchus]|uniref:Uncharacterized protein n=2 Tax=Rangifer tarandus platyrhynchus TaxID=3082113 RepID=A0AC59YAC7_RANTA|nr:unnamed protein product [Rangifer tarandus platyrhynchus]
MQCLWVSSGSGKKSEMPTLTRSVVRVRHNGATSSVGLLGGSWVYSEEQRFWRYTVGLYPNSFSVWPQAYCLTPLSKPRFQTQICSSYLVGLLQPMLMKCEAQAWVTVCD